MRCRIPSSLFTAVLKTSVSSHHAHRLLTILEAQEGRGVLSRHSAFLIAYVLFASGDMHAKEKGLDLLLVNIPAPIGKCNANLTRIILRIPGTMQDRTRQSLQNRVARHR